MARRRISVPTEEIKKRCICKECGRDVYVPAPLRPGEKDRAISPSKLADRDEHIYPHPDTWEP